MSLCTRFIGRGEGMDRHRLLKLWEEHHGPLDARWRDKFLADDRVRWLSQQPDDAVRLAVSRHKKLTRIIEDIKPTARPRRRANVRHDSRRADRAPGDVGGFYRMPKPQKAQRAEGTCHACGAPFGADGRCRC